MVVMMAGLEASVMVEAPLPVEADPQARVGLVAPVPPRGTAVATTSQMGVPLLHFQTTY